MRVRGPGLLPVPYFPLHCARSTEKCRFKRKYNIAGKSNVHVIKSCIVDPAKGNSWISEVQFQEEVMLPCLALPCMFDWLGSDDDDDDDSEDGDDVNGDDDELD